MNIFHLDQCPVQSAKWHVQKHKKMILESAQLLCTAFWCQGIEAPYKKTHQNHPTALWVRESSANFDWCVRYGMALVEEFRERDGNIHKSFSVIEWCRDNKFKLVFPNQELTPFAVAISEDSICRTLSEFNNVDTVGKYRLYYKHDKEHLHDWKRNKPEWI